MCLKLPWELVLQACRSLILYSYHAGNLQVGKAKGPLLGWGQFQFFCFIVFSICRTAKGPSSQPWSSCEGTQWGPFYETHDKLGAAGTGNLDAERQAWGHQGEPVWDAQAG